MSRRNNLAGTSLLSGAGLLASGVLLALVAAGPAAAQSATTTTTSTVRTNRGPVLEQVVVTAARKK